MTNAAPPTPGPHLYHGAGFLSLMLILRDDCLNLTSDDEGTEAVFLSPELDQTWKYTSAAFGYESPNGGIIVLDPASLSRDYEIQPHRYLGDFKGKDPELEFIVEKDIRNVGRHIREIIIEQQNVDEMLADPKAVWDRHEQAVKNMGYLFGTMSGWFGSPEAFAADIEQFLRNPKVRIIPDRSFAMQAEALPTP